MKFAALAKNLVKMGSVITLLSACGSPYNGSYNNPPDKTAFHDADAIPTPHFSSENIENSIPVTAPAAAPLSDLAVTPTTPSQAVATAPAAPSVTPSEPETLPSSFNEIPPYSIPANLKLLPMPSFQESWGIRRDMYEKVAAYYQASRRYLKNSDYVTIVDFSKRSSEKRFFIFDLRKGKVISLLTTHGTNSDPQNKGFATEFSNTEDSLQSSLGFFLTLDSYEGSNGYSLRLRGLETTNSNAEKRGIVVHSAPYVSEDLGRAGRSWGCLALDPKVSRAVINHLMQGSLLYIGH
jgi:hypothetical protein